MLQTTLENTPNQTPLTNLSDLTTQLSANEQICHMTETYSIHMDNLQHKNILLENPNQKTVCIKTQADDSRYTPHGIQKIKAKIRDRLSAYPATFGILLTLTIADETKETSYYDGKPQLEAWKAINKYGREFTDEINKWRKRHGLKKIRAYLKRLENQSHRNYPHLHLYFPGLKALAPIQYLQKIWPYGNVDYQYTDSTSPADYLTKYLSKMEGRDFMNVMLYSFRLRLYSNSRGLRYGPKTNHNTGWRFTQTGSRAIMNDYANQFIKLGYSKVGQSCVEPRGP